MKNKNNNLPYLHGFSKTEQERLYTQAKFSEFDIYQKVDFSNANRIIEIGSGVGAQTEILLRRFPALQISCIDSSDKQIATANEFLKKHKFLNKRYEISKMNATSLDFDSNSFDGAFICWLLEHVDNPLKVLGETRRVLKNSAPIFITEVLNSSFFLEPYSPNIWKYWMGYNDFQYDNAGDPFIGAKLGNLLLSSGFQNIQTEVKTWFFDNRCPDKRKMSIDFWRDLLMSAKEQLIKNKYTDEETANKAEEEFEQVARDINAVFFYSFVQAKGQK